MLVMCERAVALLSPGPAGAALRGSSFIGIHMSLQPKQE